MNPVDLKDDANKNEDNTYIYLKDNKIGENELNSQKIPQNKRRIHAINTDNQNQNNSKTQIIDIPQNNKEEKEKGERNINYLETNISVKNIVDDALFTQLSEINVKLLDFNKHSNDGKIVKTLPKIDYVEIKLLNQNVSISELKTFGFGLYVFFLYLISLLVTFIILAVFAFHYMYRIFYDYYRDYEDEFSFYSDYNLLTLVSGSQILRFRKYIIEMYGKETFLENYKDFDVFYKEYIGTGTAIFIIAFIINFIFLLYILRVYRQYKIDNPEIKDYSLILSGNDVPYSKSPLEDIDKIKNDILKELKIPNANVDINFTLKLSDYYEKMEKHIELTMKENKIQNTIKRKICCCNCCCCSCRCCFHCCCNNKYQKKKYNY